MACDEAGKAGEEADVEDGGLRGGTLDNSFPGGSRGSINAYSASRKSLG